MITSELSVPTAPESAPVSSAQRTLPLQARRDLTAQKMDFQGTAWWVVKDPVALRYFRLHAQHYRILCLLDGRRSLKDIRDVLIREFPAAPLALNQIQRVITDLYDQGLILSQRPGRAGSLIQKERHTRWQSLKQTLTNVMTIRLPGWDPDGMLTHLHRWLKWVYHPAFLCVATLFVLSAWTLLLVQFHEFVWRLPAFREFFTWGNLLWLWMTLAATKVIHEFGHGLTCKHFGAECHEMGVMLLVFSPTLYCDVTDSWMLRNKWDRIWISAAGIMVEVFLSAIAIFVWRYTTPGLLNHLALNVFFVTTITTVIFNANPLLQYDGYYMLGDWLGIPNLKEKSSAQLQECVSEHCLGIHVPRDPLMPTTGRIGFLAYAVASAVYGWIIMGAVLMFLYTVLKPYGLQSLGITLAAITVTGAIVAIVRNFYRLIAAPRSEPMSRLRMTMTIALVLAAVGGILFIPLPWYIEAPFLAEPHSVAHVYTKVPGELTSFDVRPGQMVERGDVLATLTDFERNDRLRELETARDAQLAEIELQHALDLSGELALAQQQLQSIDRQIDDLQKQIVNFQITAPISGRTVAAPRIASAHESTHRSLRTWSGDISNPENLGSFLNTRTHMVSIAPDDQMQVVLFLDQAYREDLAAGREIQIKFEHLADKVYRATIEEISREQSDVTPFVLSAKSGGELATVTDSDGRERLISVAYQARAVLEQDFNLLKPGMRGTARFLVDRRSPAQWIWRAFCRTFVFRL